MIIANFEQEEHLLASGYDFVLGIDEAGRGPLAGPVVAAVCVLRLGRDESASRRTRLENKQQQQDEAVPRLYSGGEMMDKKWNFVRDSKTLSEKQREAMFDFVQEHFYVGVGICDHETIDRMNILEASFLAMKKAIVELKSKCKSPMPTGRQENGKLQFKNKKFSDSKCIILVDGNKSIPSLSMEQLAIVSGDKLVKSIAAASIVAKVTRDRIIREADKLYPEYGFCAHKGYGTKVHIDALKKYGPCPIHRKTFAPVKDML
jgi:ribonuclease HII